MVLVGTAPGYSLHIAPKYKLAFKSYKKPADGSEDLYNYFNFLIAFGIKVFALLDSPNTKLPMQNLECAALSNISGTRLYNCLIGMNFYHCPLDAVACPGIEFNGCLGENSQNAKKL